MSHDARGMIEVNEALMVQAARAAAAGGADAPLVVSVATWGRGCRQELLRDLEGYRFAHGFNGSIVAVLPGARAAELLGEPALSGEVAPGPGRFLAVGVAFKRCFWEWLAF